MPRPTAKLCSHRGPPTLTTSMKTLVASNSPPYITTVKNKKDPSKPHISACSHIHKLAQAMIQYVHAQHKAYLALALASTGGSNGHWISTLHVSSFSLAPPHPTIAHPGGWARRCNAIYLFART